MERVEIYLSENADWNLFNRVATELKQTLGGKWVVQADGLDQRYWDLEVEGQTLTLHLEHFSGIMLLVKNADPQWVASERFQSVVKWLQKF